MSTALVLSEGVYDLVFANMAYSASGQAFAVATTYAFGYTAEILVTILGAGFLDYFDRRKIFVYSQFVKIAIFASVVVVGAIHPLSAPMIWAYAFSIDLIHHYSRIALFTLVVSLFEKAEIPEIQGTNAVLSGTMQITSPLLAGAAIGLFGLTSSLGVSVALQLLALITALVLFRIAKYRKSANEESTGPLREQLKDAALSTLRAARDLARDKTWRGFLTLYTACGLLIGVTVLLWIPLLRGYHGVSDGNTGWYLSIGATGLAAGGFIVRRFGKLQSYRYLALALFLMSLSVVLAIVMPGVVGLIAGGTILFHLGLTLYFGFSTVLIQISIPSDRMGSWYGVIDFVNRIFGMVGVLCAGVLFDLVGPEWLFGGLAVVLAASATLWLRGTLTVLPVAEATTPATPLESESA